MTWPNPSVLLVAFAWMCGVWKDRHKQKVVPCRLRDKFKVQARVRVCQSPCAFEKDSGRLVVRALCSTAEHTNGTPRTHESQLVSGAGLEFFWTATSSSISRAIAEPKSIVGSKSLLTRFAWPLTLLEDRYAIIIPKGKDHLPTHGSLLGCSSPNNVLQPSRCPGRQFLVVAPLASTRYPWCAPRSFLAQRGKARSVTPSQSLPWH
jgi:hypothetical protein